MNPIVELMPVNIQKLVAYESARSLGSIGSVFLDANELPWAKDGAKLNRYPSPQPIELLNLMSGYYQIESDQLIVGRGSDEAIDNLIRCFCQANVNTIITCPPTYGMYDISAQIQGAGNIEVPLITIDDLAFQLDVNEILNKIDDKVRLIFLCSPNNPTGNLLNNDEILNICRKAQGKALVVVDEAYIEFSGSSSLSENIKNNPNLVILRTLSKAHGLAGLRTGVAIAQKEIIAGLNKVRAPYPIPEPVINLLVDYFNNHFKNVKSNKVEENVEIIVNEKKRLVSELMLMPFVQEVFPSAANFLLVKFNNPALIMKATAAKGIILRDRGSQLNLKNTLRITIGDKKENDYLLQTLKTQGQ